jgi:hypothetical protein
MGVPQKWIVYMVYNGKSHIKYTKLMIYGGIYGYILHFRKTSICVIHVIGTCSDRPQEPGRWRKTWIMMGTPKSVGEMGTSSINDRGDCPFHGKVGVNPFLGILG